MTTNVFPTVNLQATGANILRLRKERGLSVKDLQAYFGFEGPQAIYKWQWGESLPTVDNLFALSKLFNISMDRILIACDQDFFVLIRDFLKRIKDFHLRKTKLRIE